jgi:hypothetical protein
MDTIVKLKFGSHLYGTSTPESDTDFKGIFMPDVRDIILGKAPKSVNNQMHKAEGVKNTKEDVDVEMYSLHYFIKLALAGETVALDMLHAPQDMLVGTSPIWEELQKYRHLFYTKNLKSFVGYAMGQAAKYGLKGSRLNVAQEFVDLVGPTPNADPRGEPWGTARLGELWDTLPVNEHARMIEDNANGIKQYQICGKILQSSQTIGYAHRIMKSFIDKFGERAKQAASNEGIDWKAMSHALRAAYQVKSILQTGTIQFPLKEAPYLTDVKLGKLDFLTNVMPELEGTMDLVVGLSAASTLPEQPDHVFWENWLYATVLEHFRKIWVQ